MGLSALDIPVPSTAFRRGNREPGTVSYFNGNDPLPTSWARTLAGQLPSAKSEHHTVTHAGVPASDEQEGNGVTLEGDVQRGMNMNSVEDYERRDAFREADVESPIGRTLSSSVP